jgi:uncharacterized membrane protein HdeD (DUF308 family)
MSTTMFRDRSPGSPFSGSDANDMNQILARNWWLIALRGVTGVIFGLCALILPFATLLALVLLFSAYMIVDGIFSIAAAIRAARRHDRWGSWALQGVASLAAGVIAFFLPGATVFAFVVLVAAWSIVMGCLLLAASFRIDGNHGRWWLVLNGAASIVFGVLAILAPLAGAVVLTWWVGAFALVFGVLLIILSLRLRSRSKATPSIATGRRAL